MTSTRSWFKKAATSGAWVCYILAASAEEADALHTQQISRHPALAQYYCGSARVEAVTPAEVAAWLQARSKAGGVVTLTEAGDEGHPPPASWVEDGGSPGEHPA